MKVYKLSECEVGMTIPTLDLTVKKLWPAKTGASNGRPWMIISGMVSDGEKEMKVAFWNREQVPQIGDRFFAHSVMGKQGLTGLTVKEEDYQGKISTVLHVTKSARIEPFGQTPQQRIEKQAEDDCMPKYENKMDLVSKTTVTYAPPKPSIDTRIAQYGKLYEKCLNEAAKIGIKEVPNLECREIKDIASCLFIQAVKEGLLEQITINETEKETANEPF